MDIIYGVQTRTRANTLALYYMKKKPKTISRTYTPAIITGRCSPIIFILYLLNRLYCIQMDPVDDDDNAAQVNDIVV